jgi:hypothetical protein
MKKITNLVELRNRVETETLRIATEWLEESSSYGGKTALQQSVESCLRAVVVHALGIDESYGHIRVKANTELGTKIAERAQAEAEKLLEIVGHFDLTAKELAAIKKDMRKTYIDKLHAAALEAAEELAESRVADFLEAITIEEET